MSVGEVSELNHAVAVAEAGQSTVSAIKTAIRGHAHVYMDETTWREDGDNGYVWAMSTTDGLRAYTFASSRAGLVPEGLLRGFTGTLVTDFYGGYNHTPGRHQRCWVHLLRDLHDLLDTHAATDPELLPWIEAVIQTYRDAKALTARAPPHTPTLAERRMVADTLTLVERVQVLGRRWARAEHKAHPAHALCKRLLRHDLELFQFVRQPGLAAHNNLAERSVRPLVIARKISGGTRSQRGSHTRMALQKSSSPAKATKPWLPHAHGAAEIIITGKGDKTVAPTRAWRCRRCSPPGLRRASPRLPNVRLCSRARRGLYPNPEQLPQVNK